MSYPSKEELHAAADRFRSRTEHIMLDLEPVVRAQKMLTKEQFVAVCNWKSPRIRSRAEKNDSAIIEEVTAAALNSNSSLIGISVLTTLYGVQMPVASCFLHWFHTSPYPILDFRALETLEIERPSRYTIGFWLRYVEEWRDKQQASGLNVREFDRALWQISKEKSFL